MKGCGLSWSSTGIGSTRQVSGGAGDPSRSWGNNLAARAYIKSMSMFPTVSLPLPLSTNPNIQGNLEFIRNSLGHTHYMVYRTNT
jgi:hypothetical protein